MKITRLRLRFLTIALIATLVPAALLLATGESLPRSLVGGGGGRVTGTGLTLHSAIGQPVVGQVSNGYTLCSGFWCGDRFTGLYLPLIRREACHFPGPEESEPNNTYETANGPLCSGRAYTGRPDDNNDYYRFHLNVDGLITINLTGIQPTEGVQLQLHYNQFPNMVYYVPDPGPYTVEYEGAAGAYYLRLYAAYPNANADSYTLVVTYP